jgi:hypothetical protein
MPVSRYAARIRGFRILVSGRLITAPVVAACGVPGQHAISSCASELGFLCFYGHLR